MENLSIELPTSLKRTMGHYSRVEVDKILRGVGNAVKQQNEPLFEDSDVENLYKIASNVV